MADVEVNDLAAIGLMLDPPARELPPSAVTTALNVRVRENRLLRIGGRQDAFGTLSAAPYKLIPVRGSSDALYWIYLGLAKAYVFSSGTEYDITNTGGDYTTANGRDWNYTIFGGLPIITNNVDPIQFWSDIDTGQELTDLTNWPANSAAKLIRAHGPFLVALNLNLNSTLYPHGVLWSHPADPGSVPSSWDYTDATKDAGLYELPDAETGNIQEAGFLRGQLYIHKDTSIWSMRYVGGQSVFAFERFLEHAGVLASRCVGTTGDGKWQFVVTQDDVIVHNGQTVLPILEGRARRTLFGAIDSTNFRNSFVFSHPTMKEIWFCYPESGATLPSRALIWNYGVKSEIGVLTEAEVDFVDAALGDSELAGSDTWASEAALGWEDDDEPWSVTTRNNLYVANPTTSTILQAEVGITNDGTAFTATIQREALAIVGKKPTGEPIVDFSVVKFVRRVWPRITGGPVFIRVGVIDMIDGPTIWSDAQTFDPQVDLYVDFLARGVAISIEVSAIVPFEFSGYKLEVMPAGRFA